MTDARRSDYIRTDDPRIQNERLDVPITIADAVEVSGIPSSTIYDWIKAGHLTTESRRPRKVTLRNIYAASARVHDADTRTSNLRQNRPISE